MPSFRPSPVKLGMYFAMDVNSPITNLVSANWRDYGSRNVQMIRKRRIGLQPTPKNVQNAKRPLKRMADAIT
jgi:hypothetical protein